MWFGFGSTFGGLINETLNSSCEEMKKRKSNTPVYYPIMLKIQGEKCVVVGGGKVALRKVKMLLECGAKVTVISPILHQDLVRLAQGKAIHLIKRDYKPGDLDGAVVVIAGTDAEEVNQSVAHEAKKRGILVNVVDDPGESDFIVPSFLRRGDLTIAISTGGTSPALAKKIRTKLGQDFGKEYGLLLPLMGEVRSTVKEKAIMVREKAWQEALDLDSLIGLIQKGQREKAKSLLLNKLKAYRRGYKFEK
jgi:siroheme synthase-like protein